MRTLAAATALICAALLASLPLAAQEQQGPLPLPPPQQEYPAQPPPAPRPPAKPSAPATSDSKHAPSGISKELPAIPVEQIIKRFGEREVELKTERDNFTYSQMFVVQTIDDSGRPDGEYRMDSDITYPSGKRTEMVTYAPQPTLERIMLTQEDFDDLKNIQPFVLTTEEMPKYNITYVGREQLDEVGVYVFDAAPKIIAKGQRYFQGRIWVDDKDLEIVRISGKAVPDILKGKNANVSLPFVTYFENIEGHFWFPTYTHSDSILNMPGANAVRVRMTVHSFNYKRFRSTIRLVPTPQNKP